MNFILSVHRGPLLINSLLKKTSYGISARQLTFFTHHVAPKYEIPCAYNQKTAALGTYVAKRAYSDTLVKGLTAGSQHKHAQHWLMERLCSFGSFTSFLAMFIHPCQNAELFFALMISMHTHMGIHAIMVDYLRPAVVGNFIPKLIPSLCVLISLPMLILLAWVAVYGNGVAGSLQQLWYLDPTKEPYDAEDSKLHKPVE